MTLNMNVQFAITIFPDIFAIKGWRCYDLIIDVLGQGDHCTRKKMLV